MAKVVVGVRMAAEIRDEFMKWAAEDRRSLGNYLEALFMQERERRLNGEVTLASLDRRFDQVMDELADLKVKKKKVSTGSEIDKILEMDLQGVVTPEKWKEWVYHVQRNGFKMTTYKLSGHLEKLIELDADEWDCNELITYIIKARHSTIYLPPEWSRSSK